MATIYYRSMPTETYQDLLDVSRDARDLYTWLTLGEKHERTGLVTFHTRLVKALDLSTPLADVLGELAESGLVHASDMGRNRYIVALLGHVEWMAPVRDGSMLIRWRKDAESAIDCPAKEAWTEALNRKCANTNVPVGGGRHGGVTPASQGGDPQERKRKETKGNETKEDLEDTPTASGPAVKEGKKKAKPTLAQKPPTFEDLHTYAISLEYSDDALRDFIDYWTSVGWRTKAGPKRDAQALLRTNKRMKIEYNKWTPRSSYRANPLANITAYTGFGGLDD